MIRNSDYDYESPLGLLADRDGALALAPPLQKDRRPTAAPALPV